MSETDRLLEDQWRRAGDDLIAAYPPPEWDVALSLPAIHATAVVLVDYAMHGSDTPTGWPHAVANSVSGDVRAQWQLLRPLLAHGTVWRDFVLFQLDRGDAAQQNWDAFREWTAALTDDAVRTLTVEGVLSGLRYYRENMNPMPVVERHLAAVGTRAPARTALAEPDVLRPAVEALAASWNAPADQVAALAFDPLRLKRVLLNMLDAVWRHGFAELWTVNVPRLRRAVVATTRRLEEAVAPGRAGAAGTESPVPPGLGELVLAATGRQLASSVLDRMRSAERVVFFPGLEMGRYVAVEEAGYGWPAHERPREWRVFYEPASKPAASVSGGSRAAAPPHPDDPAAPPTGGPGVSPPASPVDIEAVVLGLEALGDRTRLAIVRSLHAHGEMFTGEVAERLGVHPSTASRHLAQLEAAQLVRVRRDGKLKLYMVDPGKIQAIASFLQKQFG